MICVKKKVILFPLFYIFRKMSNLVKLNVIGLTYSQTQSSAYALVLGEENGSRRIPIVIGSAEAQSIAMHLQSLTPSRPLTHDLFVELMAGYKISLVSVIIYKFEKEIFYSELLFNDADGKQIKIDSRTSDAVALAVRAQCPIFTTEEIMTATSVFFDEDDMEASEDDMEENILQTPDEPKSLKENINMLSVSELQSMLENAIREENYEKANLLSEEIKKRKSDEENKTA
jgi:bifunctional DNase/RNase